MSKTSDFIKVHRSQLDWLVHLTKEIKKLQLDVKKCKAELKQQFLDERITGVSTSEARISLSRDTESARFDVESFKQDHPSLYEEYLEYVPRTGTLTVYLK